MNILISTIPLKLLYLEVIKAQKIIQLILHFSLVEKSYGQKVKEM